MYIKNTPPSISWDGKLSGESHYAFDANENVTGQFISGALMLPADMRGELNASASTSNIFFQLAPHSEVSMSLDVVMNLYATPGSLTKGSAQVVHWARADGEELNQASVSGSVGLWNDSFTDSVDRAETLTLGFVNSSDQWMYGSFGFNLRAVFSQGVVTAVPEAPAPAMLAAGVGLLGLWGRRRSRARS
ncbi:PEP-CTERM sorting domain-containing protein [Massilia sp. LC238]|uniref:PEP-CTERM sorting domain-containing protein n=1 Tax=Massilia sp. LC238 TaxID=1502852 RepID=UPI00126A6B12|nr:PEP-CTERM sorting domain-containing protein [Massilia sp. LC238]